MERSLIAAYILYKSNPDNDDRNDSFFASSFGFSIAALQKAKKENPEWVNQVLEARRAQYAEQIGDIDKALFQAARCGDTKAADLLYRRFDGWNPRIIEQTTNYYNFADIVKDMKGPRHVRHIKKDL